LVIVPKFSEDNYILPKELIDCIEHNKVEIQMLSKDLIKSFSNCTKIITPIMSKVKLEEVVIHMPFGRHTFDFFISSLSLKEELKSFLLTVEEFSNKFDLRIGILFHQEHSVELIENTDGFTKIKEILDYVKSDNIYFFIENCLPDLNYYDSRIHHSFDFIRKLKHPKVFACIDVCHARCYENCLKDKFVIPEDIRPLVKWIHFAGTYGSDGYIDKKKTHGRRHLEIESIIKDLELLSNNGVDISNIPIILEVSENDYINRPEMLEEFKLIKSI